MKFQFLSTNKTSDLNKSQLFHENLFKTSKSFDQSSDDEDYDSDDYIVDNDYNCSKYKNQLELNHLSLPLTETIAEFVQELSDDKFFINDISFIFELSRKRAISPCAIIVALIYLKRLKTKTKSNLTYSFNPLDSSSYPYSCSYDKYSANCLSNTELCLISLLLASKYLVDEGEDDEIYNDEWADLIDYSVEQVNSMEKSILKQMDWELFVSEKEFWNFTKRLTERITRKKVKFQHYQCTYTDLDYLLSNSKQFSINAMKTNLNYVTKIILICSSTIVYMALSSFILSTCVFYLKNQLLVPKPEKVSVVSNDTSKQIPRNDFNIIYETNDKSLLFETQVNPSNPNGTNTLNGVVSLNKTDNLFDKFCSMNDNIGKIGRNFFSLFDTNKKQSFQLLNLVQILNRQSIDSFNKKYHFLLK